MRETGRERGEVRTDGETGGGRRGERGRRGRVRDLPSRPVTSPHAGASPLKPRGGGTERPTDRQSDRATAAL